MKKQRGRDHTEVALAQALGSSARTRGRSLVERRVLARYLSDPHLGSLASRWATTGSKRRGKNYDFEFVDSRRLYSQSTKKTEWSWIERKRS